MNDSFVNFFQAFFDYEAIAGAIFAVYGILLIIICEPFIKNRKPSKEFLKTTLYKFFALQLVAVIMIVNFY